MASTSPKELDHKHRWKAAFFSLGASTVAIVLVGLLGAFLAFGFAEKEGQRSAQTRFEELGQQVAISFERNIVRSEAALTSIMAFFAGSNSVSRKEFETFISLAMNDQIGIQALEWIPRVSNSLRQKYEIQARAEGLVDFSFRQIGSDGMVTATTRDEYFPVYYVEPLVGNERALGFDLASNPVRKAALEQARDFNKIVSSARITLVQEAAKQAGVVVFAPVYENGRVTAIVEQRRQELTGFALGVFRIGDLLEASIPKAVRDNEHTVALYDVSDTENLNPLHMVSAEKGQSWAPLTEILGGLSFENKHEFGGRQWQLVMIPKNGILTIDQPWIPRTAALVSFLIIVLGGLYIQTTVRRKEYAETLVNERTADLQEANEEIKNFAYIVSHDMRSPLVSIQGFAGELREDIEILRSSVLKIGDFDEKEKNRVSRVLDDSIPEAIGFIESSTQKMSGLITAVLEISRIGRRELALRMIDSRRAVTNSVRTMAKTIKSREIEIEIGDLPMVRADALSLEQIFANLLDNAVKYASPERKGEIEITAEHDKNKTVFHIKDNGIGIAEKDVPLVFDLFKRVGNQEAQGDGVGLACVQALVRRHGGRIWCRSELGKGTTFSFSIAD